MGRGRHTSSSPAAGIPQTPEKLGEAGGPVHVSAPGGTTASMSVAVGNDVPASLDVLWIGGACGSAGSFLCSEDTEKPPNSYQSHECGWW